MGRGGVSRTKNVLLLQLPSPQKRTAVCHFGFGCNLLSSSFSLNVATVRSSAVFSSVMYSHVRSRCVTSVSPSSTEIRTLLSRCV